MQAPPVQYNDGNDWQQLEGSHNCRRSVLLAVLLEDWICIAAMFKERENQK